MRKTSTIAAVAATIIMLGGVAVQAQQIWKTSANDTTYGPNTSGQTRFEVFGAARALAAFDDVAFIRHLYFAGGTARNAAGSGPLNVHNVWTDTATFGTNITGNNVTVDNYWLQVGQRPVEGVLVQGVSPTFGTTVAPNVVLTDDSLSVVGGNTVRRSTGGTLANTQFGIDIANGGTAASLEMNGGTVNNAGRIENLIYGGGIYNDVGGTIGDLTFSGTGGVLNLVGWDNDGFVAFSGINVEGEVNLAGASLLLNLSKLFEGFDAGLGFDAWTSDFVFTYGTGNAWEVSWASIFGTDSITGSVASVEVDWGDAIFFAGWSYGNGDWIWNYNDNGIQLAFYSDGGGDIDPVPEPATLMILGLGLAGLGLARRRGWK